MIALLHTLALQMTLVTAAFLGFLALNGWRARRTAATRMQSLLEVCTRSPGERLVDICIWLGRSFPFASDHRLRAALARAGYDSLAAVPAFNALRLIGSALAVALVLLHPPITTARLLSAIFAAFFVSRGFALALKLRGEARQWEIRRELPPLIDILLMVLGSGASIDQSVRYVGDILGTTAPHVGEALRRAIADIDNGMPYDTAFARFGQRLGSEDGDDLAALLKQALLQGGEIVGALERFGAELSDKRVSTAREQIGRKAVQLTMVMLVFFMPVLMIVLAGPAVTNIFETLGTVKHQIHAKEIRP